MLRLLTIAGLILQLAGAAVTGWGASLIWRPAASGQRFMDPAVDAIKHFWRLLTNPILRWIGRPRSQTIQIVDAVNIETAGSVRVSKTYSSLAADLTISDAVAELDRRSQALSAEIVHAESRLLDKIRDQGRRHDELSKTFNQYVNEQDENAKRRDRRGIRIEAIGLALVTAGAILQALGSLLAPTPESTDC